MRRTTHMGFALTLIAATAWAGAADHKYVSLRGRVADASGLPVADARLEATGSREAIALTGSDGRFMMTLDLGPLESILRSPVRIALTARKPGQRISVAGGETALVFEVRLAADQGQQWMESRSNFGLIADALLDALAPPGERTAVLQVRFVAQPGDAVTTIPPLADERHRVQIAEPWLTPRPAPVAAERPATRPAPAVAADTSKRASAIAAPAPAKTRASKREKPRAPKVTAPKPTQGASVDSRLGPVTPGRPMSPSDSLRLLRDEQRRAEVARAEAQRESVWRVQQARSRASKATTDSLRAIRDALEDSLRRARFGLPPRPTPLPAAGPENARAANAGRRAPKTRSNASRVKPTPITADKGSPSLVGALQRIEPRPGTATDGQSEGDTRQRLEADSCTCRVRGTVELEFERLLTRPMRIEVGIRELPAMRDTIEMFMGSPRSFEFPRVPCGRWSLSLRPFSERPFGVTTPEQIAPFDCGQRALRQVRIVIAPL